MMDLITYILVKNIFIWKLKGQLDRLKISRNKEEKYDKIHILSVFNYMNPFLPLKLSHTHTPNNFTEI